jgi:hypothetical protein
VLRRRRAPEPVPADPLAAVRPVELGARWRAPVERVLDARARFRSLAARVPPGPLEARLADLGGRVDAGVLAAWGTARRADAAEAALAALGPRQAGEELKAARRRVASAAASGVGADEAARLEADVRVLAERFASLNRLWDGVDRAEDQLRGLEARIDAVVATAAGLLLGPGPAGPDPATAAAAELEAATAELAALDAAFAELRGPG